MLERLAATRWDVKEFARLLGVETHPGQDRFFDILLARDQTRYRCENLTIAVSAGNRAGKTLMLAIAILHHCIHKLGLRPPDPKSDREVNAWWKAPFHWYHFGIQQEVGELVYFEMVMLLDGTHPAQKGRGCPLTEELGPIAKYDQKERGEYRWVVFDPIMGGAQVHFRTTNEKALGSLGKDMNGLSFDECGFEQNLSFIVNEVMHLRRLGTGGPMVLISTPSEGFTQFADEWYRGDPESPTRERGYLSMRMSTRDNIGYGIDRQVFDRLVTGYPPSLIPQNIDGYFIEGRQAFFNHEAVDGAFVKDLPVRTDAVKGGTYVQGVDPALTYDSTWSIVLRVEGEHATGVSAARKQGKQTLNTVVDLVYTQHSDYNDVSTCITAVDTSGFGGKVFKDALGGISPLRSVEFGGTKSKKQKLLTDLKGMLEKGRLHFPREGIWLELRRQLLGYRIDDRKIETDAVMALAVAVKQLNRDLSGDGRDVPFEFFGSGTPQVDLADLPADVRAYARPRYTALDRAFRLRPNHSVATMDDE